MQCFYCIGIIGITDEVLTNILLKPDIIPIDLFDYEVNQGYLAKGEKAEYIYKISSWYQQSQVSIYFIAITGSAVVDMETNDP